MPNPCVPFRRTFRWLLRIFFAYPLCRLPPQLDVRDDATLCCVGDAWLPQTLPCPCRRVFPWHFPRQAPTTAAGRGCWGHSVLSRWLTFVRRLLPCRPFATAAGSQGEAMLCSPASVPLLPPMHVSCPASTRSCDRLAGGLPVWTFGVAPVKTAAESVGAEDSAEIAVPFEGTAGAVQLVRPRSVSFGVWVGVRRRW